MNGNLVREVCKSLADSLKSLEERRKLLSSTLANVQSLCSHSDVSKTNFEVCPDCGLLFSEGDDSVSRSI